MSIKGQSNFIGTNGQAMVSLKFILHYYNYPNFLKFTIEGVDYEDFTLFFRDQTDNWRYNAEVKWKNKKISFSNIRDIIQKELDKAKNANREYSQKDKFFIVVKTFNKQAYGTITKIQKKYEWMRKINFKELRNYDDNVDKLLLEGWTDEQILFLNHVNLIEEGDDNKLKDEILNYFRKEDTFYYGNFEEEIFCKLTEKLKKQAETGVFLNKIDLKKEIDNFKNKLSNQSESFDFNQPIGKGLSNLNDLLSSKKRFKELTLDKYLIPLSNKPAYINHIIKNIETNDCSWSDIKDFMEKYLLEKRSYSFRVMLLIDLKFEQNLIDSESVLANIKKVFSNKDKDLLTEFSIILKLISKIINKEQSKSINEKILDFIDNNILYKKDFNAMYFNSEDYYINEYIPKIIETIFKNLASSKKSIDYICEKFTYLYENEDSYISKNISNLREIILDFIDLDFRKNFQYVLKKSVKGYNDFYLFRYGIQFKGYEVIGFGASGFANDPSISDLCISNILSEAIQSFYEKSKDKNKVWRFLKPYIEKPESINNNEGFSKEYPVFLKRSFISFLLINIQKNKPNNKEFLSSLKSILKIKKGFPHTEEVLFNKLRKEDLNKYREDDLIELIKIAIKKYGKTDSQPSFFIVATLLEMMIHIKSIQAMKIYKNIIQNKDYQNYFDFNDILGFIEMKFDPKYHREIFIATIENIDLNHLLTLPSAYNDNLGKFISKYISISFKDENNDYIKSLSKFFKNNLKSNSNKRVFTLFSTIVYQLSQVDPEQTFNIFKDYISKKYFYNVFKEYEGLKTTFVQLSESLIKEDKKESAEIIIDIAIKDPNVVLERGYFDCGSNDKSLHKKFLKGEENRIIITMRGHLCWSISRYIEKYNKNPEDCKRAFNWVKVLINLNGELSKQVGDVKYQNNYIRFLAFYPLSILLYKRVRNNLNKLEKNLGYAVKDFAFQILRVIKKDLIENNYTLSLEASIKLVDLFYKLRDLNTKQAKEVLNFFKDNDIEKADRLFLYYAIYRKNYYKDIPFESYYFEKLLEDICKGSQSKNLKRAIAYEFYKSLENSESKSNYFKNYEKYFLLLLEDYNEDVNVSLPKSLEILLKKNEYFKKYIGFYKEIARKELKISKNRGFSTLNLLEVMSTVIKKDKKEFLKLFDIFLEYFNNQESNFFVLRQEQIFKIYQDNKDKFNKRDLKNIDEKIENLGL